MFNFIGKYLKNKRQKEELAKLEKEKEYAEELAKVNGELEKHTETMLNSYCAIEKNKCAADCIHYSPGHVYEYENFSFGSSFWYVLPKCKLWR